MIPRILIRHVAGSKANRIEQFQLDGARELIIGRGPAANVAFDGGLDDTVSRRHAIIRITRNDRLSFTIADLGSSNGVRVNGKPIQAEQDLLPDDIVELSPGGPAFRIAVEPESLCLADDTPARHTSIGNTNGTQSSNEPASTQAAGELGRSGPRLRYSRLTLFTALVAAGLGAGALSYKRVLYYGHSWMEPRPPVTAAMPTVQQPVTTHQASVHQASAHPASPTPPASPAPAPIPSLTRSAAAAPATTPSAAVVYLEARWRLYDKFTGEPVFQKTITRKGQRLPCFVELSDHRIVPWLTTEDEEHTNDPVGGVIRGTGFIVSGRGSIVTSRHIAAGWTVRYHGNPALAQQGLLFRIQDDPDAQPPIATLDLAAPRDPARLIDWVPGEGGYLFRSRYPVQLGASKNDLEGRNEILNVLLPSSHDATPAHLIRAATNADLAELKIDEDRQLPVIELAPDSGAKVGQRVRTLGYAGSLTASLDQAASMDTAEVAGLGPRPPVLPDIMPGKGTIVGIDRPGASPDTPGTATAGSSGNIYQLSLTPARPVDGGPLLDDGGKAIGIVASDTTGQATHVYAYSVGFVRALLQSE
jgi:S1-C subfamily serine protease